MGAPLCALACLGLMAALVSATCADLQAAYGNPSDILSGVTFSSKSGVPTHTVNNRAVTFTQATVYRAVRDNACSTQFPGNAPTWGISTGASTFLGSVAGAGVDINAAGSPESGFIFTCCYASLAKRDTVLAPGTFTCNGGCVLSVVCDMVVDTNLALTSRCVAASCVSHFQW